LSVMRVIVLVFLFIDGLRAEQIEVDDINGPVRINIENYNSTTYGKTVFVRQSIPWCGFCNEMNPAWNELGKKYRDHEDILIAELTCTADVLENGVLCEHFHDLYGLESYPSLLYGDPLNMKVYDEFGEHRSFSDMDSFVQNLKKRCSPSDLDLCEERTRIKIETFLEMEFSMLKQKIADIEKTITDAKLGYLKAIEDFDAYYKTFLEVQEEAVRLIDVGEPRPERLGEYERMFPSMETLKVSALSNWKIVMEDAYENGLYIMNDIVGKGLVSNEKNEESPGSDEL